MREKITCCAVGMNPATTTAYSVHRFSVNGGYAHSTNYLEAEVVGNAGGNFQYIYSNLKPSRYLIVCRSSDPHYY